MYNILLHIMLLTDIQWNLIFKINNWNTYLHKFRLKVDEISDKLGSLYSEMIFKNGFVHSDPHPGNLLVNKDKNGQLNLILLDHGLYAVRHVEFK